MLELAQASTSQLDREEEATNGGELSAATGIEPQSIGGGASRGQVLAGNGGGSVEDMSALGSELHESYPNDNVKNTLGSASKLRIVRILAPEATQNGTQNVTMGKFIQIIADIITRVAQFRFRFPQKLTH